MGEHLFHGWESCWVVDSPQLKIRRYVFEKVKFQFRANEAKVMSSVYIRFVFVSTPYFSAHQTLESALTSHKSIKTFDKSAIKWVTASTKMLEKIRNGTYLTDS